MHNFELANARRLSMAVAIATGLTLVATSVLAGTGGDEFSAVYDTLVEWSQGTLGRIIAIAMILVGLVAGVVRQSIMSFVMGLAGGMGLYNAPAVIEAVMTATITADFAPMVSMLSNGLS